MENINLKELKPVELIELYSNIVGELYSRSIIRTKNLVGELGEYLAIEHYNNTTELPNLKLKETGYKGYDAVSETDMKRYSIRCTIGHLTGSYSGIEKPGEPGEVVQSQLFDYLIIVKLDEYYKLEKILELSWDTFLKYRRWNTYKKTCILSITKKLEAESKVVFSRT